MSLIIGQHERDNRPRLLLSTSPDRQHSHSQPLGALRSEPRRSLPLWQFLRRRSFSDCGIRLRHGFGIDATLAKHHRFGPVQQLERSKASPHGRSSWCDHGPSNIQIERGVAQSVSGFWGQYAVLCRLCTDDGDTGFSTIAGDTRASLRLAAEGLDGRTACYVPRLKLWKSLASLVRWREKARILPHPSRRSTETPGKNRHFVPHHVPRRIAAQRHALES